MGGGKAQGRRYKTSVPVIGFGFMGADETATDPRAKTQPISSVICHCEEAGMLSYLQKPFTVGRRESKLELKATDIDRERRFRAYNKAPEVCVLTAAAWF
jgi:hypothetical protein